MIALELNANDAEALLRHARDFVPNTCDAREDARLADALADLAEAIEVYLLPPKGGDRYERALIAATGLFGDADRANAWLNQYVRALEAKPVELLNTDVGLERVLALIGRLEHGVFT